MENYAYLCTVNNKDYLIMDEITRQDVLDLFANSGWNLFGKWVDEVADAIADEVVKEYKEAGDGNLQKAISYVLLDKFDKLG